MPGIICETEHFVLLCPDRPHIPREDGGHVYITTKERVCDRTEFSAETAQEFILFSMACGAGYKAAMKQRGIEIGRINYQENGNWAFRKGKSYPPYFHLHLYGRTEGSVTQPWGQALSFPDPDTGYYEGFTKLAEEDIAAIRREILRAVEEEKYKELSVTVPEQTD